MRHYRAVITAVSLATQPEQLDEGSSTSRYLASMTACQQGLLTPNRGHVIGPDDPHRHIAGSSTDLEPKWPMP
ncbi:hypothetical protein PGTUg99_032829 [Puccinia graminis f. sp. tritici]|uniref:Uncharacterized protein n=1 Tax=Puccinia graminis f. sp. tritici TaxID=56615 RepID=A0A5B0SF91_PUCGR|nr:hypothetical protein PGTUg99_032829 [Puccinia graminis f. sp. tritici]